MTRDRPSDVAVRAALPGDDAAVCDLMTAYLTEAFERYGTVYGEPMSGEPRMTAADLTAFRPPDGLIALAQLCAPETPEPTLVGVAAARSQPGSVLEVKRMYVAATFRDRGVGAMLLDWILTRAASTGAETIRLDTNRFMTRAQQLYEARGFRERDPYSGTEIATELHPRWRFYERPVQP